MKAALQAFESNLIIFIFLFVLCTTNDTNYLYGQSIQREKIAFQSLTIDEGLSQGMINQILQDQYGFMWFATKDGLNKYDGISFEIFRHDAEDSTSLSDGHIQSMYEDSNGKIWIGTLSGGLDLYDHTLGKFYHILPKDYGGTNAKSSPVIQLIEDNQKNIWVLYKNSIRIILNGAADSVYIQKYTIKELEIPQLNFPVLFTTRSGGIYFFNFLHSEIYSYSYLSSQWTLDTINITSNGNHKVIKIYNLFQDVHSERLYAFTNIGIIRLGSSFESEVLLKYEVNLEYQFQSFIDQENQIWFKEARWLCVYNINTNSLKILAPAVEEEIAKVSLLHSSFIDRSGLIWFGTKGYGLLTLNLRARKFHHMEKTSVYNIRESDDGRILINSGNNQYKVLDKSTGIYTDTLLMRDAQEYSENFNEFSIPSVLDGLQRRWFANHMQLAFFNRITKEIKTYSLPKTKFNEDQIEILDILVGKEKVWLSTSNGVFCFSLTDHEWRIYRNKPEDNKSLSFDSALSLCLDPKQPDEFIWVGTNGGGLNGMNTTTGDCVRYSIKNGLPNDVIYSILQDDHGRLWMSTNKGISCFDIVNNTFKNYEEKDGLQSNEFNRHAFLRSSDGTLFFGGVNGYNYFNPDEIESNPISPKMVFRNVIIKNQDILLTPYRFQLNRSIYLTSSLTVLYKDNIIKFEYGALDYIAPEKNQYQYILEGFDDTWVNAGNLRSATYTNLNPRKYTFKVKGSNADGIWNEEAVTMKLTIVPPWYMTIWFRAFSLALLLALAYIFYNYRLNQSLKLLAIRNRIATDLHDEIGSNLSNIAIFSAVAQQKPGDTAQLLKKISNSTRISMEAMNDIVWMINTRNDNFENIINRMRQNAAEVLEAKGYEVHFAMDDKMQIRSMNMEVRKHFYLIFKEAINNIAKYAHGKNVWIELSTNNRICALNIKDDGVGFDTKAPFTGNGLNNLNSRAAALHGHIRIKSIVNQGTEIKLEFKI